MNMRNGERRDLVRCREQEGAECDERCSRPIGRDATPRKSLLDGYQPGYEGHPREAHDPKAKSDAIKASNSPHTSAVLGPHLQRAGPAITPRAEQQAEGTSALPETYVLERRQFVDRRHDERGARDDTTGLVQARPSPVIPVTAIPIANARAPAAAHMIR